ncbi:MULTISPECIES: hypothetical protein [unclassified Brevundimonas]|uniref:hypothetical protein n=1 Tax=unclassified Brevundimonas TaxID=2622653 RepID=UPI0025C24B4F|nr:MULTISPECIES: hypothetical protein [unclassified Brevundimonas]
MLSFALALFVPLAAPAQIEAPCQTISRPIDHWGRYQSKFKVGSALLAFKQGVTDCTFDTMDTGRCLSVSPGVIYSSLEGRETWFSIPDQKHAEVRVQAGTISCTVRPLIRMD